MNISIGIIYINDLRTSVTVYSAGALVIWKEDGYYGFLCDKNALYGNLHFFADQDTVAEDDESMPLGKLPSDRLRRGQRVRPSVLNLAVVR